MILTALAYFTFIILLMVSATAGVWIAAILALLGALGMIYVCQHHQCSSHSRRLR